VPRRIHDARRRLSPEIIQQLIHDYEAGQSTPALMTTYGLGKGAVLRLLEEAGVQRRGQGQKNIQLEEAIQLYEQGWSLVNLAVRYDCNGETVRQALMGAGVKLRPRSGRSY
jgi:hypothetical protein